MGSLMRWFFLGWFALSVTAFAPAMAGQPVGDAALRTVATAPDAPAAVPAEAKPDASEGVAAWVVSQGKTVTYRVAASIDALVVGYLYTGTLLGGGGIALFNAVVSSVLYDTHEIAWNTLGPDPQSDPTGIALTKTISYRMVSIANVLATGLLFTGNFWLSSGLALGNAVIDSSIYFFHELAWNYWGPTIRKETPAAATATADANRT
ncbi:MAG: DUF2061 domain-containing protein [Rhodospirillaceae bacterium]